jgi:hypothetical protein
MSRADASWGPCGTVFVESCPRAINTTLLEIDTDTGRPNKPETLNSIGRRQIRAGYYSSKEGVLYHTNVAPRGRRIIDQIWDPSPVPERSIPSTSPTLSTITILPLTIPQEPPRSPTPSTIYPPLKKQKSIPLSTRRSTRTRVETAAWLEVKDQFVKKTRK